MTTGPFEGSLEAEIPIEYHREYFMFYNQRSRMYLSCEWDKKHGDDVGSVVLSSKPYYWTIENVYGNWSEEDVPPELYETFLLTPFPSTYEKPVLSCVK